MRSCVTIEEFSVHGIQILKRMEVRVMSDLILMGDMVNFSHVLNYLCDSAGRCEVFAGALRTLWKS